MSGLIIPFCQNLLCDVFLQPVSAFQCLQSSVKSFEHVYVALLLDIRLFAFRLKVLFNDTMYQKLVALEVNWNWIHAFRNYEGLQGIKKLETARMGPHRIDIWKCINAYFL